MCMFKTINKISHLNLYILFGSVHCSRQSSNWDIYVIPVYHLNTGIEEPIVCDHLSSQGVNVLSCFTLERKDAAGDTENTGDRPQLVSMRAVSYTHLTLPTILRV